VRAAFLFFLLCLAVYHANLRPVAPHDSLPGALLPFSLVLDGGLDLDRFGPWLDQSLGGRAPFLVRSGGHHYSGYPVGQALLLTPFYLPMFGVVAPANWSPARIILFARILEKLFAAALAAVSVALFYLLALRMVSGRAAALGAFAFAFATPVWSINSQALWQHTSGVLLLLGAFWCLLDKSGWKLFLAGLLAGLAITVRPTNTLFAAAVAVVLIARRQPAARLAAFLTGPALCAFLAALYNLRIFGDLRGGYALPLEAGIHTALAGLLFSPSRGLFIYCPFLLVALAGISAWRWSWQAAIGVLFCAGHLLLISVSPMWWGGHCWGPRMLAEMMPFLVLLAAFGFDHMRGKPWLGAALAALLAWSVFLQFLGAFCYPRGRWDDLPVEAGLRRERLWEWRDSPITRTLKGGLVLEPHAVLVEGLIHGPAAASEKMRLLGMKGF
jgi:hypothetical protein